MDTLIADPLISQRLINERKARGIDRFDEIWDGVYVMAPAPNDEHQQIETRLARPFLDVVEDGGLGEVRLTINLASNAENWENDYRIPDIVVFLNESTSRCHDTFWTGPPDFLVEIISPNDKSREKLEFYTKIGTKELLLVDRNPWQLELYFLRGNKLVLSAVNKPGDAVSISSQVLPLSFQLLPGKQRPKIEVVRTDSNKKWTI